jgi:hypothetical protein
MLGVLNSISPRFGRLSCGHGLLLLSLFASTLMAGCGSAIARVEQPTLAATKFAQASATLAPTLTPEPIETATLTSLPAATQATDATSTIGPTLTPTLTPAPPPALPLRDDLPPMTLKDWPRPDQDNGLGIHFLLSGYYNDAELDKQIARIQSLHLKWSLVIYADENQLHAAAKKFKQAGIMVVWRKALRPYQRYSSWGRDIDILKSIGMPPYMQLYNEPEVPAEWDGLPIDTGQFVDNLMQATKDVYNAGGYPGIQFVDEDSLRQFIDQIYARKGEAIFHRMFFIPHAAGLNHPPDYVEDSNGVLGFSVFAKVFFNRLGFVPPFIIGEGGWKINSQEDNRFPAIDENLHRDYTLAVYGWFRTGKLSNGEPLPDYLFAFCVWMLAGANEAGAWYDSFTGDRTQTIQAVQQLPLFVRKFSYQ